MLEALGSATVVALILWGTFDIARRILLFLWSRIRKKPKKRTQHNLVRVSNEELEQLMISRANAGDKDAVVWLLKHGFQQRAE